MTRTPIALYKSLCDKWIVLENFNEIIIMHFIFFVLLHFLYWNRKFDGIFSWKLNFLVKNWKFGSIQFIKFLFEITFENLLFVFDSITFLEVGLIVRNCIVFVRGENVNELDLWPANFFCRGRMIFSLAFNWKKQFHFKFIQKMDKLPHKNP